MIRGTGGYKTTESVGSKIQETYNRFTGR